MVFSVGLLEEAMLEHLIGLVHRPVDLGEDNAPLPVGLGLIEPGPPDGVGQHLQAILRGLGEAGEVVVGCVTHRVGVDVPPGGLDPRGQLADA